MDFATFYLMTWSEPNTAVCAERPGEREFLRELEQVLQD